MKFLLHLATHSLFTLMMSLLFCGATVKTVANEGFKPCKETIEKAKASKALVTITFHFDRSRFQYLAEVLYSLLTLSDAEIIIITNTSDKDQLKLIQKLLDLTLLDETGKTGIISTYENLEHPFNLTWCHKEIITHQFLAKRSSYTHFIYLEDDITFDFDNLCYFIELREVLKPEGLIPSFLRVEQIEGGLDFFNTDNGAPININHQPHLLWGNFYLLNVPNPYTACYVLDTELAQEYIKTKSFDIKTSQFIGWKVRERAAMGLCFENVPLNFQSRYVVAVSTSTLLAPKSTWVYHLPNNYLNNPFDPHGKVPMNSLFFKRD
ncbi:MAG: hypothetical protein ACH350_07320 [Parachlamydiaceae bacterium]